MGLQHVTFVIPYLFNFKTLTLERLKKRHSWLVSFTGFEGLKSVFTAVDALDDRTFFGIDGLHILQVNSLYKWQSQSVGIWSG